MKITLNAYAKVNITLDVLRRRPDGYHELRSIMHAVSLHDTVTLEPAPSVCVTCGIYLPPNNTARRAAELFEAHTGHAARIHIEKRIPSQAGLGGASADAAAVLRGLCHIYGGVTEPALFDMARQVGADVPFCLLGGCALAEGIGERLTPLPPAALNLLLVKGEQGVSTAALFGGLRLPLAHPNTGQALAALQAGELHALCAAAQNALEPAACALVPNIATYKKKLLQHGALAAAMTGSGSCVAGIFQSGEEAERARAAFAAAPFAAVCQTGAFRPEPIEE
ncbi:MAG: 4-(cytidine 5'-diphospho)-2-C-methyl-D-erythritol kinase [Christensenellaceae bacterium]|jgi:4-diphosphocytidyl-2-C-methyl-D-erythritol kinase|nr:4-(cytidine 5'-diphospho)-2-C-methyl-D-erythritol kinase [Christensenellaceae bacterium]